MSHERVQYVTLILHALLYLGLVVYTLVFLAQSVSVTVVEPLDEIDIYIFTQNTSEVSVTGSTPSETHCEFLYEVDCDNCCAAHVPQQAWKCAVKRAEHNRIGWTEASWAPEGAGTFFAFEPISPNVLSVQYITGDCFPVFGAAVVYPLRYSEEVTAFVVYVSKSTSAVKGGGTFVDHNTRVYGHGGFFNAIGEITVGLELGVETSTEQETEYDIKELCYLAVLLIITAFEIVYVVATWCKEKKPRKGYQNLQQHPPDGGLN